MIVHTHQVPKLEMLRPSLKLSTDSVSSSFVRSKESSSLVKVRDLFLDVFGLLIDQHLHMAKGDGWPRFKKAKFEDFCPIESLPTASNTAACLPWK